LSTAGTALGQRWVAALGRSKKQRPGSRVPCSLHIIEVILGLTFLLAPFALTPLLLLRAVASCSTTSCCSRGGGGGSGGGRSRNRLLSRLFFQLRLALEADAPATVDPQAGTLPGLVVAGDGRQQ